MLIATQFADEPCGHRHFAHRAEVAELRTRVLQLGIHIRIGERIEQHIDERELPAPEAHRIAVALAQLQHGLPLGEARARQEPDGAVGEFDHVLTGRPLLQHFEQRHTMFTVRYGARDVEPVDPRLCAYIERAGRHHGAPFVLHLPTILHERAQRAQQHMRRQREPHAVDVGRVVLLRAEGTEPQHGVPLG